MRIEDLRIGEEYGYAHWKGASPDRVRLLAIEKPPQAPVTYRRHYRTGRVTRQARLQFMSRDGLDRGDPAYSPAARLVGTWAEVEEDLRQRDEQERRRAAYEARKRGAVTRLRAALARHSIDSVTVFSPRITPDQANALAEVLERAPMRGEGG
jgi:hypothetical protein